MKNKIQEQVLKEVRLKNTTIKDVDIWAIHEEEYKKAISLTIQKTIDEVKAKIKKFEFPVFLIDERGMTEEHLKEMEKSRKELLNSIEEIKFDGEGK